MLGHLALVRSDVSEERIASIIRVARISELGTPLTVIINDSSSYYTILRSVLQLLVTANVVPSPPIIVTLMKETLCSSETSILTRAT
jgi:hypothetical protein